MTVSRLQAMNFGHDGFMDMAMGGVLLTGALLLVEGAAFAVIFVPFIFIGLQALKASVTQTRLRPDEAPTGAATSPGAWWLRWALFVVAAAGVLVFMAVDPYASGAGPGLAIVMGLLIVGAGLLLAARAHEMHFYAYALFGLAVLAATAWQVLDLQLMLIAGGGVALAFGIMELFGFLRHHPLPRHH